MEFKSEEISLSTQFDMERIRAIVEFPAIATIVQMKPEILVELWNAYVIATRYERTQALLVEPPAKQQQAPPTDMPEQNEETDVVEQALGMMKQKINSPI